MLTVAEQDILNDFIGPDGYLIHNIINNACFSFGCKIMYLQRAITFNCHMFLNALDMLYDATKPETLTIIRSLKHINDLCFNHQIQLHNNGAVMTKSALEYLFASINPEIKPYLFQQVIQEMISKYILYLSSTLISHDLKNEMAQQIFSEARYLTTDRSWRQKELLPYDQILGKHTSQNYISQKIDNLNKIKLTQFFEPTIQKLLFFKILSHEEFLSLSPIQFEMLTNSYINTLLHGKNICLQERLEVQTNTHIDNIKQIYQTFPENVDLSFNEILGLRQEQRMAIEYLSLYITLGIINPSIRCLLNLDDNQIQNLQVENIQFLIFGQVLSFQEGLNISPEQRQKILRGESSDVVREIKYPGLNSCCTIS